MAGSKSGNGRGSVYKKREKPTLLWAATVTLADGTRKTRYAPSEQAANDLLVEMLHDRKHGVNAPKDERQSVAMYLRSWLETVKPTVRDSAYISYEKKVRLYLIPRLGRVKLARLTSQEVQEAYAWMLNVKKLSPTTVSHTAGVLKHALKDAVRKHIIPINVCEQVDPPKKVKRKINAYTREQVAQLLTAADGSDYEAIITLAVTTGARLGELLALKFESVDLDRARITIQAGRAETLDGWADTAPKTDSANRVIPLTARVVSLLRDHRKALIKRRLWLGDAWQDHDYVFPNQIGGQLGHATVERAFARVVLSAGLKPAKFHDLRHTAASLMLANGVPVAEVARILGHASPAITLRLYAHAIPGSEHVAVAAMEAILGG
jgi:integrase